MQSSTRVRAVRGVVSNGDTCSVAVAVLMYFMYKICTNESEQLYDLRIIIFFL